MLGHVGVHWGVGMEVGWEGMEVSGKGCEKGYVGLCEVHWNVRGEGWEEEWEDWSVRMSKGVLNYVGTCQGAFKY